MVKVTQNRQYIWGIQEGFEVSAEASSEPLLTVLESPA